MIASGKEEEPGIVSVIVAELLASFDSVMEESASAFIRMYLVPELPEGMVNGMDSASVLILFPRVDTSLPITRSSEDQIASLEYRYSTVEDTELPLLGAIC